MRSRRDYNRYELIYDSVLDKLTDIVKPAVLLETSFYEISFPTVILPVHSYIGDLFEEEAPEGLKQYELAVFPMKVQSIDKTLPIRKTTTFLLASYWKIRLPMRKRFCR